MKILITGAGSIIGHPFANIYKHKNLTCWDKGENIADGEKIKKNIRKLNPDIIINTAGYTDVDKAQKQKDLAFSINALGVKHIAEAALAVNAIVVHFSHAYVFDGKSKHGYTEKDIPKNPVNVFGASKLAGEKELQKLMTRYYIIRTGWLFGPYKDNFVKRFLAQALVKNTLHIINDQWSKPTYTLDLARSTKGLLDEKHPFGIYHLTNEGTTNWYELTKRVKKLKEAGGTFLRASIKPISSDEVSLGVPRPMYAVLHNKKMPRMRSWEKALESYLSSIV